MKSASYARILVGLAVLAAVLSVASCDKRHTITGPPPPPPDSDGDGVPDASDNCRSLPGEAAYAGCPWYKVDYCSGASPYTATVKWETSTPAYYLATSLPSGWRDYVDYAASSWNNAGARIQIKKYTTVVNAGAAKDGRSVVSYGDIGPSSLGRTLTWYSPRTGLITEADIILNSTLNLSVGGGPSSYDVYSVLAHEFGHFCGLGHVSDRTHTMYPSMPPDCTIYRTLCLGDGSGLRQLYP